VLGRYEGSFREAMGAIHLSLPKCYRLIKRFRRGLRLFQT
jgi:hypothetical protein